MCCTVMLTSVTVVKLDSLDVSEILRTLLNSQSSGLVATHSLAISCVVKFDI